MENAVTKKEGTDVQFTDEELQAMIAKSSNLQQVEASEDGVKADYILLAKPGSKALKRSEKDLYIEGLQIGDFYIQKDKVNLGHELKVVPLAFLTVYNEKTGSDRNAQFLGLWNKEQAMEYPLVNGSFFDRQLPNGHILVPSHWVAVEISGHPEIENAIIAYKSTGSRIFKAWKDDAKKRAASSATLIYKVAEEAYNNDKYDWTDIGFTYVGSLLEASKEETFKCVKKSNEIREAYQNHLLIANRAAVSDIKDKELPDAKIDAFDTEESYDDEEVGF